jgi:hypothetical protein
MVPVAEQSKAQICDQSIAGIADSNKAKGMDFRLAC